MYRPSRPHYEYTYQQTKNRLLLAAKHLPTRCLWADIHPSSLSLGAFQGRRLSFLHHSLLSFHTSIPTTFTFRIPTETNMKDELSHPELRCSSAGRLSIDDAKTPAIAKVKTRF